MTKNAQNQLLQWFYQHHRSMPWRENPSPYRVWVSEVMLQQTTVATVHSFFGRFMERFPRLEDLAQASEEEVLTLWAGLGYYSRAKNLLKTAQLLQKEENFPSEFVELLKMPGIGAYTAGAICSIAFHHPVSLIDTNVDRVLGRFFAYRRTMLNFEKILRSKAQDLIERIDSNEVWAWNQALMELGSLVCGVKKADCLNCPLVSECKAFELDDLANFPGDKIKAPINIVKEYALVIKKNNRYLLRKIVDGTRRKGLYDFIIRKQVLGLEYKTIHYRISNSRVERVFCLLDDYQEEDSPYDIWVDKDQVFKDYPIVSPCKHFFQKY
ncbi:MAG: A/G-specific adenine glycosylase [Brevinema sp.]